MKPANAHPSVTLSYVTQTEDPLNERCARWQEFIFGARSPWRMTAAVLSEMRSGFRDQTSSAHEQRLPMFCCRTRATKRIDEKLSLVFMKSRNACISFLESGYQVALKTTTSRSNQNRLIFMRYARGLATPMSCKRISNRAGTKLSADLSAANLFADHCQMPLSSADSRSIVPGCRTTHRSVGSNSKGSGTGFTFVELLIVVAILSILTAIALPAYRDYVLRGKVAESLIFLGDARGAVNDFYSRWGRMPADNSEAGLRQPEELRGNYVRSISVADGVMVASMDLGNDSDNQPLIRTLTFRPWLSMKTSGSPIIWSCGQQDPGVSDGYQAQGDVAANPVEIKWLPSTCRD